MGTALASDGASLGEALAGLRETWTVVRGSAPDFEAAEALSVAWSDATLQFLQDVSCEDPLTGLASQPHLRSRLSEVYREAVVEGVDVRLSHALLVVDTTGSAREERRTVEQALAAVAAPAPGPVDLHFSRALRLATVAEGVRSVFLGGETVARVGPDTVVALVRRTPDLGVRAAAVRATLVDLEVRPEPRVWVEGLPGAVEHAGRLLDDLVAR